MLSCNIFNSFFVSICNPEKKVYIFINRNPKKYANIDIKNVIIISSEGMQWGVCLQVSRQYKQYLQLYS